MLGKIRDRGLKNSANRYIIMKTYAVVETIIKHLSGVVHNSVSLFTDMESAKQNLETSREFHSSLVHDYKTECVSATEYQIYSEKCDTRVKGVIIETYL